MEPTQKRGRPATGRTSKTVRVPLDMNTDVALQLYYDILPTLVHWYEESRDKQGMPRYDRLLKLYAELALTEEMIESGK